MTGLAAAEGEGLTTAGDVPAERLLAWIRLLSDEVGPRRPTGSGERRAAELMIERLGERGVRGRLEEFAGFATFGATFGVILALALAPAALPRRRRLLRGVLAAGAAAALAAEGGLVRTPISDLLARHPSQNLVAEIEPRETPERTVCLLCHLDTSRGGLLFHPAFVPHLTAWLGLQSAAVTVQGGEALFGRSGAGRRLLRACRAILALGASLLAERELRGVDAPGANDNASGVAVVAELATELAAAPLRRTRVVVLMAGCEEAGLLGTQAFLRSHDTSAWLFVNVDSVGGPGNLRYLTREGIVQKWSADPALTSIAARLEAEQPELGLRAADAQIGLTYDATAVIARGGRALTLVAEQGGVIPNYHWPTDTAENLDPAVVGRALSATRELVAAIDRGEADL